MSENSSDSLITDTRMFPRSCIDFLIMHESLVSDLIDINEIRTENQSLKLQIERLEDKVDQWERVHFHDILKFDKLMKSYRKELKKYFMCFAEYQLLLENYKNIQDQSESLEREILDSANHYLKKNLLQMRNNSNELEKPIIRLEKVILKKDETKKLLPDIQVAKSELHNINELFKHCVNKLVNHGSLSKEASEKCEGNQV